MALWVSNVRDASAKTARYGTGGFDPQDRRRLDRRTALDIMKQDLRRQKANRIHTEALLRKVELMQASPRRFDGTLPVQMPQLPTVYSRVNEREGLPGWALAPAPYL